MQNQPDDLFRLSQLLFSLRSLRRYNTQIPVFLNIVGEIDKLFLHFLTSELGVLPVISGSYQALLDGILPGSGAYLTNYPILHKFLFLLQFRQLKPTQVLYVDTDTFFFDDPARLFEQCREQDIYARLENYTSPQTLTLRPGYFRPEVYAELATNLNSRVITPFNTGVMLLNNRIWERFAVESQNYLSYVLSFSDPESSASIPGYPALPYPTSNRWIRDQVAFWLVLGRLADFTFAEFTPTQLLMGAEEIDNPKHFSKPVLSHYFSQNTEKYFKGLSGQIFSQEQS